MFFNVCSEAHHAEILHSQGLVHRVIVAVASAWLGRFAAGVENTPGNIHLCSTQGHDTGVQSVPRAHLLHLILCRMGWLLAATAVV